MLKLVLLATTALAGSPTASPLQSNDSTSQAVEFLGIRFCMGPSADKSCDVHFQTDGSDSDRVNTKFSVFGKTVCLGSKKTDSSCDIALGQEDTET